MIDPGIRLGPYEITGKLGEGGMGEVYRATDSRLGREVALKVLPEGIGDDPDRHARFEREAKVLASLNHPHIAHLYALEHLALPASPEPGARGPETDAQRAPRALHVLVMELVEGPTLADRLSSGPLGVEEALAIAKQIAEALEEAHEKGIVHRDLKPANVKVRPDGTVKVLDFGLAKAMDVDRSGSMAADLAHSPTLTAAATQAGIVLGTAAYMAPEQAKGFAVDRRADIWAFGVVLYEMLTGARLFVGDSAAEVMAGVLKTEIDLAALPAEISPEIRRLLRRCLERNPRKRLRDIGDARLDLDYSPAEPAIVPASAGHAPTSRARPFVVGGALLLVALAGAASAWLLKPAPALHRQPVARARYPVGSMLGRNIPRRLLAISPDGRTLATVVGSLGTESHVEIRRFEDLDAVRIPGSERARSVFFSPDSRFVGFATDTALRKVPVGSSEVSTVAEIGTTLSSGPAGVAWGDDGRLYYGALDGIRAIPASGGTPQVVAAGAELRHPSVVPGARWLLYTRGQSAVAFVPDGEVVLRSLDDGAETTLTTGTSPVYLPNGILLVARADGIFAAPLSLGERRLVQEPVMVVPQVALLGSAAQYDVSATGTLVHLPGNLMAEPSSSLVRVGTDGVTTPLSRALRPFSDPRVSPDGRRVALHILDEQDDVWTFDPSREALTRLTFEPGEDETPVWSPDGRWIAFSATRGESRCVIRRRSDGSGSEEVLWRLPEHAHVTDWSPDGRSLLIDIYSTQTRTDIVRLDLGEKLQPRELVNSPYDDSSGRISPDGRFFAYRSDESGRDEIYVQPFPDGGGKVTVSTGGGVQPVWSRDGRALFYRSDTDLMVARLGAAASPAFQPPVALSRDPFARPQGAAHTTYDVFPDGSFLWLEPPAPTNGATANASVIVAFHWLENLEMSTAVRR
jgi:hypothetical protein